MNIFKKEESRRINNNMSRRDHEERWSNHFIQSSQWNPPLHDPTQINIPVSASARIRFEPNTRDAMNSRIWESVQYDTRSPNSADIQTSNHPVYQDMNPIGSRNSSQNYNQQQQYFPDPPRPAAREGIAARPDEPRLNPGIMSNPYLQRLDPIQDARNIPREMRSAVYEDNREREVDAARQLSERQFQYRFLPQDEAQKAATLQAFELLRPKTDDFNKSYRY